jgi:hypothetical protein
MLYKASHEAAVKEKKLHNKSQFSIRVGNLKCMFTFYFCTKATAKRLFSSPIFACLHQAKIWCVHDL